MAKAVDLVAYYIVDTNEGLKTLFGGFISLRERTLEINQQLARELGVTSGATDNFTGVLTAVNFPKGKVHPQFKKPKEKGLSYPKAGTEWEAKFKENIGWPNQCQTIANYLGLQTTLFYKKNEDGSGGGNQHMGQPLNECGWLYQHGTLGFFIPNVEEYIAQGIAEGKDFEESSLTFNMDIQGCIRVTEAEWDLAVAAARVRLENNIDENNNQIEKESAT